MPPPVQEAAHCVRGPLKAEVVKELLLLQLADPSPSSQEVGWMLTSFGQNMYWSTKWTGGRPLPGGCGE